MKEIKPIPQSIIDVKDHYSKATGIPCMILDLNNQRLFSFDNEDLKSVFSYFDPLWEEHCLQTHLHSAFLSERFGGSYIYFCLISLLYWVSPVIIQGKMDYAIIAGPVTNFDMNDLLEEDQLDSEEKRERFKKVLHTIPQVEISRIHNLSEVLRMCSGWASGYSEHVMVENRHSLEFQSLLSESIQELKRTNREASFYYPIEKERLLQEAIQWGNREAATSTLNELLGMIFYSSGNSMEFLTFRIMELLSLFSRAAVRGGGDEEKVCRKTFSHLKEIRNYYSFEGFSQWLSTILHSYIDMVITSMEKEYDIVIAKALRYIHAHYKTGLTLDEVAESVALSPHYFSHLFNSNMGLSFSTYVNKLRIEYAQHLLLETSHPIIEIAAMAGFVEQSYFSRIFKEISGVSPGKFRIRGSAFPSENHEIHTLCENGKNRNIL